MGLIYLIYTQTVQLNANAVLAENLFTCNPGRTMTPSPGRGTGHGKAQVKPPTGPGLMGRCEGVAERIAVCLGNLTANAIVRGGDLHRMPLQAQAAVHSTVKYYDGPRLAGFGRVLPAIPLAQPLVPIDRSSSARLRVFAATAKRRKENQDVSSDSLDASSSSAVRGHNRRVLPRRPARQSLAAAARAEDAVSGLMNCSAEVDMGGVGARAGAGADDTVDIMACVMDR